MKKKNLALALALLMLAGCKSTPAPAPAVTEAAPETTAAVSETEKATEAPAEETAAPETEAAAETTTEAPAIDLARDGEVRDIAPAELIAEMNVGWNLGNSLDAYGSAGLLSETCWGNPKTTQEMVDAVSAKGFNTIRIPVTWGGHIGPAPDYTVDEKWMARVQEVVNYAYDDGMYIILDSHHEEEWRIPDDAHIDTVCEEVSALWAQIADNFKDYGDHLIFEGSNEPRMKGSPEEWNGGKPEGWRSVDRLNQTFIDAVRSTGGNNENRLLLMATYANSAVMKAMQNATVPDDPHIAFSIHAYTPYAFTYANGESWELFNWDGTKDNEIEYLFNDLENIFLSKGVSVIITEMGAVNKNGNDEDVARWVTAYLTAAKAHGVPCVWWDNGYYESGNELFGIFDRQNCKWFTDTVVDAIMAVYQ